jgi:hypothetical protein
MFRRVWARRCERQPLATPHQRQTLKIGVPTACQRRRGISIRCFRVLTARTRDRTLRTGIRRAASFENSRFSGSPLTAAPTARHELINSARKMPPCALGRVFAQAAHMKDWGHLLRLAGLRRQLPRFSSFVLGLCPTPSERSATTAPRRSSRRASGRCTLPTVRPAKPATATWSHSASRRNPVTGGSRVKAVTDRSRRMSHRRAGRSLRSPTLCRCVRVVMKRRQVDLGRFRRSIRASTAAVKSVQHATLPTCRAFREGGEPEWRLLVVNFCSHRAACYC